MGELRPNPKLNPRLCDDYECWDHSVYLLFRQEAGYTLGPPVKLCTGPQPLELVALHRDLLSEVMHDAITFCIAISQHQKRRSCS